MSIVLDRKKILLAITGGIAAYKSAELCRQLKKKGADLRVVMSAGAQEFITPLTLQALSGNPVHTQLLDSEAEAGMGHIELAKWPDMIVVAPATANFIAKYSQGLADDLLTTLLLASTAPVAIAPAMNQAMWSNPLTQRNIDTLSATFGAHFHLFGPAAGEQACGDVGLGRMLEPEQICVELEQCFSKRTASELSGKRVVITAGPTREALDPVRYISNHSSGKMGYALAASMQRQGAEVVLVSGPTNLAVPENVVRVDIESASDMLAAVNESLDAGNVDIFIACAAVADYAPIDVASQKIKKQSGEGDEMTIKLFQNPDIVASVAAREDKPFTVGFAAETHDVLEYARSKLKRKNLDLIIANDVSDKSIGFNSDENAVHVISAREEKSLGKHAKTVLADKLASEIVAAFKVK